MPSSIERLLAFDLWHVRAPVEGEENPRTEAGTVSVLPLLLPDASNPACVIGADEVGRGALAGPVVVACVAFPLPRLFDTRARRDLVDRLDGLDDSKRLGSARRVRLDAAIRSLATVGIGSSPATEIDRWGIVPACRRALERAYRRLGRAADLALLDRGLRFSPGSPAGAVPPCQAEFTRGDARSLHIAAASVVAKVARDQWMTELSRRFPSYSLDRHKGYGTARHLEALERHGASAIHRATYLRGVRCAKNQSC